MPLRSASSSTTAIEAVVQAGDLQMARFGRDIRVDKKGTIDLVTEVDVAVERMFRALIAERFPDHADPRRGARRQRRRRPPGPCWVFDPIDGTTNYAHGLPIFCSSLALEIDGVAEVGAVYDPNAQGAVHGRARRRRVPERHARCACPSALTLVDAMLVTGFPYDVHQRVDEIVGLFGAFVGTGARRAAARIGGDRSVLRRRRTHGRLLGERPEAVGHRRRAR